MHILWIKAFHIIALVAWFSGLFYLPRLFVYHCEINPRDSSKNEDYNRFSLMEYKLYYYIMMPSAVLTTVLGLLLLYKYTVMGLLTFKTAGWMHAKITLVLLLWFYHLYCGKLLHNFINGSNNLSQRFYRFYNEVPTIFLFIIVILTVIKPF